MKPLQAGERGESTSSRASRRQQWAEDMLGGCPALLQALRGAVDRVNPVLQPPEYCPGSSWCSSAPLLCLATDKLCKAFSENLLLCLAAVKVCRLPLKISLKPLRHRNLTKQDFTSAQITIAAGCSPVPAHHDLLSPCNLELCPPHCLLGLRQNTGAQSADTHHHIAHAHQAARLSKQLKICYNQDACQTSSMLTSRLSLPQHQEEATKKPMQPHHKARMGCK